jgi:hypothetical protein
MFVNRCLFCGGDASEPDHWRTCDGRQGHVEAEEPGPVLDAVAARQARDAGIAQVEAHADETFQEAALAAVHQVAYQRATFCVDDVWATRATWPETHDRRALGAVMQTARRLEWIEPTDQFVCTTQRASHAAPVRVWRSLLRAAVPA